MFLLQASPNYFSEPIVESVIALTLRMWRTSQISDSFGGSGLHGLALSSDACALLLFKNPDFLPTLAIVRARYHIPHGDDEENSHNLADLHHLENDII